MTDGASQPPRTRRPRYAGNHPRRFEEKYKERDPARFPEEREKVLASGKTPAGSHVPVLALEVLAALEPKPGDFAVDATLGFGGHASELLKRILPGGRLLTMDVDPIELPKASARLEALAVELGAAGAVRTIRRNFAGLRKLLADDARGASGMIGANVILADLGVSSMQLDDPARGFSWKHDVPLDLRMNPRRGQPAGSLLLRMKKKEIEDLLRKWGDEPEAAGIAASLHATIVARRSAAQLDAPRPRTGESPVHLLRTSDVTRAVESAYEGRTSRDASEAKSSSLSRTFQAIRILVNEELTALDTFLRDLPHCLAPGGRAAILTFHSGEDRRVKKAFAAGLADGTYAEVSREVVRASPEERRANPRSTAAKLRWAVRTAPPPSGLT
ncbi:MAG: 16S rRNA (cytosine(1402)-N(4))-methyltransferase RsmH [Acidobacteriota bacterium]